MKLEIDHIKVGGRFRKDMGELEDLADSISEIGLLQPIGVTKENKLVFGERRLRACRDILGLSEIEVRIVDMGSIVTGEHAENEIRKDFTPSERVAIGQAIEAEFEERRGRPACENVQKIAQLPKGEKTRDYAAGKAGFGNAETYRQAKSVVENAEPELVEAMDSGKVSILAAHKASKEPPEFQREIVKSSKTPKEIYSEIAERRREKTSAMHPMVKVERILGAMADIRDCGLTSDEFKRLAKGSAIEEFHKSSLPVLAFIKGIVEVSNDQTRTG